MKTKKEIKIEMKKLSKEVNESQLNRFMLNYYLNLKYEELPEARDAVKYKIRFHKRLIKELTKEVKISKKNNDRYLKEISDYIDELEHFINLSVEIIKVIDARKKYFELKKEYKNYSKKDKKNTKLSETICRS